MGHSFVLSANAIPNYLKDLSLLLSSSDWLWLHRLLPTEMPSDCIWKCCAVNVITFLSALPCQWISSLFFSKIMSMVQILLHLSKSGKGLYHLPLILGKGSSELQTTANPGIQSGLGLLWQKSRPDNPDPSGQLTCCGSHSTEPNSVHACGRLAHFCWETKCCSLFFYRCTSAFKAQKPQMGQISNSDISMPEEEGGKVSKELFVHFLCHSSASTTKEK